MEEKIKIYVRSKNKIYIFFKDEIYFFENQELESVLESFVEENNIEKNSKIAVILHFSYFWFNDFKDFDKTDENFEKESKKTKNISEILKKKINFVNKKMIINHLENKFLDIEMDKREILKLKKYAKKYSLLLTEIKIDFDAVYNYFKDGNFEISQNKEIEFENKNELLENKNGNFQEEIEIVEEVQEIGAVKYNNVNRNFGEIEEIDINEELGNSENFGIENDINILRKSRTEILQLGEESSIRILIEDEKISEIEKIDLKIEDVDDIENFDFGDMIVVGDSEHDIKTVFAGMELSDNPNFIKQNAVFDKESLKNIKISDVVIAGIVATGYFLGYNSIPMEKKTLENEVIQKEIKTLEKDYLKKKGEEIPDYSKELAVLREIDMAMKRREYYSFIKFLVENSKNGIDYTKINYENAKWVVQGEMENFNNFEKFENNVLRKYSNSELGYLKDNDTATLFEYNILEGK